LETLILMVDTAALLVVVIYSLRNQKRPQDADELGPFRIKPANAAPPAAALPAGTAAKRSKRHRKPVL
jgi:hypothetical protein